MERNRLIVSAPDYLEDRVRSVTSSGEFLRQAFRRYKTVEVLIDKTQRLAIELFPDGEILQCSDEEFDAIVNAVRKQGLTILDNPQIVR